MITAVVIIASLALVAAFLLAWAFHPALRRQIEEPKHSFGEQVRAYDRYYGQMNGRAAGDDESRR